MDIITQTNRTILFDEINPEKLDLTVLVGDVNGIESLDDDKIKEINSKLLVKSFDEFIDKFAPTVYSFFNAANQRVMYTLKKPENISEEYISEIKIDNNNDFLKMLLTLIDAKKTQGTENVDFKFENILDMISPKKVVDDIRQVRKEILYLYDEYDKLEEEDPKRLDIGDKLNVKFEEASGNYNNIMGMLPLAIEDIKTRLLICDNGQGCSSSEAFQVGLLTMGDDGELKIIEKASEQGEEPALLEDSSNAGLIEAFNDDYDNITDTPNSYIKELVVRTFCPLTSRVESTIDTEREVANYNTYLEFYKNSKHDFIKIVKPLIEKILGVKMYFEQYQTKIKGMAPSLLVTNIPLEMITKSIYIERLRTFLNTTNNKNEFTNMIWYGIVPDIEFTKEGGIKLRRERFKGNKATSKQGTNTMESLTTLLDVMKDYKIQVFFSFETGEATTFAKLASVGIDDYIEKTKVLAKQEYSEYAIPCLPNFTVIPKDKSGVVIDKKLTASEDGSVQLSQETKDIMKLWIEGVYIGASYVAAGLTAAYQCPEYLKSYFKNAVREFPGVRFDLESGDNALLVHTVLAKEISGFTNKIKDLINVSNFGFVFSSDNKQIAGKEIKKITVYKARSMKVTDNVHESIYKTQTVNYIVRMLRTQTGDFKQENIMKFFSNNPSSQKSKWFVNKSSVNSVIQDGDDVGFEINGESGLCTLTFSFNGNARNLELETIMN